MDEIRLEKRTIQERLIIAKTLIETALFDLPPAEKKGEWVPVTERLPDRREGAVLVTDWGDVCYAYRNDIGTWMDFDGNKLKDVTAWMPLPEPYKGE